MTKLMYIEQPDLFEITAQVIAHGNDEKGIYLVLDQSLFYPQGGGQPADQGNIVLANTKYNVYDVRTIDGEVRHYISTHQDPTIYLKGEAKLAIDKKRRFINSKYHTAGHLIAAIAEKITPELTAIKGHQFPREAHVEFNGTISDTETFLDTIAKSVIDTINKNAIVKTKESSSTEAKMIIKNLPYALPENKSLRVCHIEGFSPVPCGGTHVKTLKDIGTLEIHKCKSKKGKTKIYYEVS